MLEDWLINRKAKKAPITWTVWNRLNKDLAQCTNPIDAFEQYVSTGYIKFNAEWFEKPKGKDGYYDYNKTGYAAPVEGDF